MGKPCADSQGSSLWTDPEKMILLFTPLSSEPLMYYLRFKREKKEKGEELHKSICVSLFHFCI